MSYLTNVVCPGERPEQGVRGAGQEAHGQAGGGRVLDSGLSLDAQTLATSPGPGRGGGTLCIAANKH